MGEVGIRKNSTPYYDQRVVAKLKAETPPSDPHADKVAESALTEVYDNRFRILMQAAQEASRGAELGKEDIRPQQKVTKEDTRQFKNFFGDWEKDPANASKVVDENGRPLVMWHCFQRWKRKFLAYQTEISSVGNFCF